MDLQNFVLCIVETVLDPASYLWFSKGKYLEFLLLFNFSSCIFQACYKNFMIYIIDSYYFYVFIFYQFLAIDHKLR